MEAKTENQEIVPKQNNLPTTIDHEADSGGGFEEASSDAYAIPFLRQLQALSPACKKKSDEYVKGAEEGDFLNTVTGKLYKGDKGVVVIPVHFRQVFNEWAPDRGGFRGSHTPAEYALLQTDSVTNEKGLSEEINVATGNRLVDTREHYVVVLDEDGSAQPALFALSSSQIKKSKKWMAQMQNIRINGKPAAMFSHRYKISAMEEHNDKGDWSGVKIELLETVTDISEYTDAKTFREMVRSGAAKAATPDEEVPF